MKKPFTALDLLECYRSGVFPMADDRHDERIFLIDPETRGVLPLHPFHVPRRLARTVRGNPFQVRVDTDFARVIAACAQARPGRRETWINRPIQLLYRDLFTLGHAHSVECWLEGRLVGGLYGVSVGAAFFGESMFSLERDASKVAMVHLAARLIAGGYRLMDAQFMTGHLAQFGAEELTRAVYLERLREALAPEADFYRLPAFADGGVVLQAISQAS